MGCGGAADTGIMVMENLFRISICVFGLCAAVAIAADDAPFSKTVYPVFEEAGCRNCHNPDGVASATRLQFPETGVPADRIEAFGKSLVALIDSANTANSLLLNKPTARSLTPEGSASSRAAPKRSVARMD